MIPGLEREELDRTDVCLLLKPQPLAHLESAHLTRGGHFPPGAVQAQVTEHQGSLGTYGLPLIDATCSKTAREKRGKAKCLLLLPSRLCVLSFRDVLPEYPALPPESALTWGDSGMGGDWEGQEPSSQPSQAVSRV